MDKYEAPRAYVCGFFLFFNAGAHLQCDPFVLKLINPEYSGSFSNSAGLFQRNVSQAELTGTRHSPIQRTGKPGPAQKIELK